jgi:hypothetical protein
MDVSSLADLLHETAERHDYMAEVKGVVVPSA